MKFMAHANIFLLKMAIVLIISVVGSQQRTSQMFVSRKKIVVLLHELCHLSGTIDEARIHERIIQEFDRNIEIVFLSNADFCANNLFILSVLMKEMENERTVAVIGSVEPLLCDAISNIAEASKKWFVAWNCPSISAEKQNVKSFTIRLLPPVRDVASAMLSLFKHFRWKRVAVVSAENGGWWNRIGWEFESALSDETNSTSGKNSFLMLPSTASEWFIERQLRQVGLLQDFQSRQQSINANYDQAVVICLPEHSIIYWRILRVMANINLAVPVLVMRLSSNFHYNYSRTLLPWRRWHNSSSRISTTFYEQLVTNIQGPNLLAQPLTRSGRGWCNESEVSQSTGFKTDNLKVLFRNSTSTKNGENVEADKSDNVDQINWIVESFKYQLLILSPSREDIKSEDWFLTSLKMSKEVIDGNIASQNAETGSSSFEWPKNDNLDQPKEKVRFLVTDLVESSFRHLLILHKIKSIPQCSPIINDIFSVIPLIPEVQNWFEIKLQLKFNMSRQDSDCTYCRTNDLDISLNLILLIVFVFVVVTLLASIIILVIRRQYVQRRRLKDPCKILLTSEDIVFPHLAESRRVEQGIEAMLCCWFRDLHEFDGPEVDKPDLIKGPNDSVKSFPLKRDNSTNSVAKPIPAAEIRARYNGDLVQLKIIPFHGNSFELRSKSLNILMMIHGLRHENLNPLIGLLVDPVRPALVWEFCSRGSLEDVLMQDEIKLDWSFRLSLLTDLVRGMKYLHSCPYRVHGSLTSRNCVIDARWVLKVTDYSLGEFKEAQNICRSHRNARDLLWTAPELLRDESLIRKGSQAGDIYSFAIIMQEVVVRGEPFCMLSLKPEEIIEKLKTPPPLIRPSVSKGAAPPEAINIMRQCWSEQSEKRPDFNAIYDLFKTLNHGRKINFVDTMFQMLEKYSNNLEELIRERTEQLDMEKKKTEQLLNRMLPCSVADKLKLGMHVDPEEFNEVTIYFSDIVGFTTISAYSTPFEVVDLLNDLYTCFDATINAYNVYKVETIGDAYMVVGGLPVRIPDHADQVATMALDLLHQSGQFKIRHLPSTPLRLRIGLHTGSCCAGVVGLTMPRYCLFGDTVNTASRLESTGSPGRIHISEATKIKLDMVGQYKLEYRGETELKGKGKMSTYWLLGKEGFDKIIPEPPTITENHGLEEDLIRRLSNRHHQRSNVPKQPSDSSMDHEPNSSTSSNPKQLIFQKSLDSSLPPEPVSHHPKNWMTKRQMTFDMSDRGDFYKQIISYEKMKNIPEANGRVSEINSGSSTPFSVSDKNIDLVGIPFIGSKVGSGSMKNRKYPAGVENDLSKPYNYYRCLPPAENPSSSKFVSKFLKRQFSMDKSEDMAAIVLQEIPLTKSNRILKQNSAGANQLEVDKTDKPQTYKYNNSILSNINNNNNNNNISSSNNTTSSLSASTESLN